MTVSEVQLDRFEWLDPSRYTFSLGVEARRATWVSGQTASRHDADNGGVTSGGDVAEQAAACWAKTRAVLEAAGRGPGDITELVEYVTADRLGRRGGPGPSESDRRNGVGRSRRIVVRPDAHLEVEVVAGRPTDLVRLP